ncbi:GDSL-type esterase/lipase family protein [Glycomyces sp. A-F 0318]|uniref:GDSL-type esterase/lipase family protein n=1 Tax=Glycomyces amatae TaxID=2881355 RepID=UPI001E36BA69|nr:GDSL-type esterase/lipase family protein [Glycomyces amatae]MCD0443175.1 GDSL-type esterase/lipase family protein [Glycomyces amatae]
MRTAAPVWAVVVALGALLAVPSAALAEEAATEQAKEPAVISLGDSFISGEAGRWQGNGNTVWGSRYGTDLAAYDCNSSETSCYYDPTKVYGSSYDNGCNRSAGAEIHHLSTVRVNGRTFDIDADDRINLACSGATTDDILRTPFKGERPQIEQLADQAAAKDVKLIVLSIGGNDIGFSDVIANCAKGFSLPKDFGWHCSESLGPQMPGRIDTMGTKVEAVLEAVQNTMADAGYRDSDYRLVLQTYPSPIPRGADNRYPETSYARLNTGGCPFYDDDSDWARDTLIPALAEAHEQAAASVGGVDLLDFQDAFDGHEVCAEGVRQSVSGDTLANPLPEAESEWARFIVSGFSQGQMQESMHPNFYGQRQMGECLNTMAEATARTFTCSSSA